MSKDLMVGSSPGATPLDDVSGLIPKHIRTRPELFAAEAENISRAISKYFVSRPSRRIAPFNLKWLYRLHREMFGRVWRWAGTPRRIDGMNIGIPCFQIETGLQTLLDDLTAWREFNSYGAIERAARLHHRAVQIHPFLNGNGRWSRMLANIMLKQDGVSPTLWPESTVGTSSEIRSEYLKAVRAADEHHFELLIALHQRYTS